MDEIEIAAIISFGRLADWRRLRAAALADPGVAARLRDRCEARGRPGCRPEDEPFRCWLAYAESVMDRDADGTVLREVFADARGAVCLDPIPGDSPCASIGPATPSSGSRCPRSPPW